MAIEKDLKMFISWSGDLAREVTKVLRAWLPKMFDHIDPWASDVDIAAGTRGLDAIQERLNESSFGIIVITTENMNKPWLNFEAGALSRRLDADPTRVVPLLVNFDDVFQLQGPISQFQATKLAKDGMGRLCRSIAAVIGLDALTVTSRFEWAWPELEAEIQTAKDNAGSQPEPPEVDEKEALSNIFKAVRSLDRKVTALSHDSGNVVVRPKGAVIRTMAGDLGQDAADGSMSLFPKSYSIFRSEDALNNAIAEIENIASTFKPVRSVSAIKCDGHRRIAIRFADGEGLDTADYKWLLEQLIKFEAPVTVETDREPLQ